LSEVNRYFLSWQKISKKTPKNIDFVQNDELKKAERGKLDFIHQK